MLIEQYIFMLQSPKILINAGNYLFSHIFVALYRAFTFDKFLNFAGAACLFTGLFLFNHLDNNLVCQKHCSIGTGILLPLDKWPLCLKRSYTGPSKNRSKVADPVYQSGQRLALLNAMPRMQHYPIAASPDAPSALMLRNIINCVRGGVYFLRGRGFL